MVYYVNDAKSQRSNYNRSRVKLKKKEEEEGRFP
jgi:hypothetical protein